MSHVSPRNEQSIKIELGIVFVPRCFRDGDESQPTLGSHSVARDRKPDSREKEIASPRLGSEELWKLGRIIFQI